MSTVVLSCVRMWGVVLIGEEIATVEKNTANNRKGIVNKIINENVIDVTIGFKYIIK